MRLSTSSLERDWLRYVRDHGYRLPDAAQHLIENYGTRCDFHYSDHQAPVYLHGPHHEAADRRRLDAELTANLEDAGYTVVRFNTASATWTDVFGRYGFIFGPPRNPSVGKARREPDEQSETASAADGWSEILDIVAEEWRPLVTRLRDAGIPVPVDCEVDLTRSGRVIPVQAVLLWRGERDVALMDRRLAMPDTDAVVVPADPFGDAGEVAASLAEHLGVVAE